MSVGLPGRLRFGFTWFQYARGSNAFEVNSVPLSTEISSGRAAHFAPAKEEQSAGGLVLGYGRDPFLDG